MSIVRLPLKAREALSILEKSGWKCVRKGRHFVCELEVGGVVERVKIPVECVEKDLPITACPIEGKRMRLILERVGIVVPPERKKVLEELGFKCIEHEGKHVCFLENQVSVTTVEKDAEYGFFSSMEEFKKFLEKVHREG